MTLTDKNELAYLLQEELMKTAEQFARNCPAANDPTVGIGAGNAFLAALLFQAPNKTTAMQTLESCHEIIRNLIENAPDSFFGVLGKHKNDPNVN